jgi:hypothetical protein
LVPLIRFSLANTCSIASKAESASGASYWILFVSKLSFITVVRVFAFWFSCSAANVQRLKTIQEVNRR